MKFWEGFDSYTSPICEKCWETEPLRTWYWGASPSFCPQLLTDSTHTVSASGVYFIYLNLLFKTHRKLSPHWAKSARSYRECKLKTFQTTLRLPSTDTLKPFSDVLHYYANSPILHDLGSLRFIIFMIHSFKSLNLISDFIWRNGAPLPLQHVAVNEMASLMLQMKKPGRDGHGIT